MIENSEIQSNLHEINYWLQQSQLYDNRFSLRIEQSSPKIIDENTEISNLRLENNCLKYRIGNDSEAITVKIFKLSSNQNQLEIVGEDDRTYYISPYIPPSGTGRFSSEPFL